MKLKNVVPWGRELQEYKDMFMLSNQDLATKSILSCGDGPASFNSEATKLKAKVTSIDPIYQFSKDEISQRVKETKDIIIEQILQNKDKFVWKNFKNIDELISARLDAMQEFLDDFNEGKKEHRYIYQELPNLEFSKNSFDIVLSSHFLFLYSSHFDFKFHKNSILNMCKVAKSEVRIFPIYDLENNISCHLEPILDILQQNGYKSNIIKSNYEFQKGVNELLVIKTN